MINSLIKEMLKTTLMTIKPQISIYNFVQQASYPLLGLHGEGYYITLDDVQKISFVEKRVFSIVEDTLTLDLSEDELEPNRWLPSLWLKKNRELAPGLYWEIGGTNLHDKIKTAKTLKSLGFRLAPFDEQLLSYQQFPITIFQNSLAWIERYAYLLSDQYNPIFISCSFIEQVPQNALMKTIEMQFQLQLEQVDPSSNWQEKIPITREQLPARIADCLQWNLDWLSSTTDFASVFQKRTHEFEQINQKILLDFISIIEDWTFNCFEIQYSYASGCECRRIVVHEAQGKLLLLAFDNAVH